MVAKIVGRDEKICRVHPTLVGAVRRMNRMNAFGVSEFSYADGRGRLGRGQSIASSYTIFRSPPLNDH